jgi:hypothetical protein
MQAVSHAAWIMQRVDALRSFAADKGLDIISRSSTQAAPGAAEWDFQDANMVFWPKRWNQCGKPNGKSGATPLEERRYMHIVQIGCPGKNPIDGLEGEERYRRIGVNPDAQDEDWCKGFKNCSVDNLLANTTSRKCRLTRPNGAPLDNGWPPREIGSYEGAVTEEQVHLSSCAFRMPTQGEGDHCAANFRLKECETHKTRCSDTLEQVWNRTVQSAHEHMQYLVYNMTEPYAQIAKLLYDLATNVTDFDGTDNLTGRARRERLWPRPLGIKNIDFDME